MMVQSQLRRMWVLHKVSEMSFKAPVLNLD